MPWRSARSTISTTWQPGSGPSRSFRPASGSTSRRRDGQERRLKELLEQLGAGTSVVKEAVSRVAGNVQAAVGSLFSDEVLKNTIAAYGFEHFEIGNYKALIATAAAAGETGAVTVLERNLREEEDMAQWLDRHLPDITAQYLRQGSNG